MGLCCCGSDRRVVLLDDEAKIRQIAPELADDLYGFADSTPRHFTPRIFTRANPVARASGHSGKMFSAASTIDRQQSADPDDIILKHTDQHEVKAYFALRNDPIGNFAPEFSGVTTIPDCDGPVVMIENVLKHFQRPCIMDCKLGTRTFLQEECQNMTPREDLYKKLLKLGDDVPTAAERQRGAVTKVRYMTAREAKSTSASLGFRLEGLVQPHENEEDNGSGKKYELPKDTAKMLGTRSAVISALRPFLRHAIPDGDRRANVCRTILKRLKDISAASLTSPFVSRHELVGTSLLFCFDREGTSGVWLIDFAKCRPLPKDVVTTHLAEWQASNHEDGWLKGMISLQGVWEELLQTSVDGGEAPSRSPSGASWFSAFRSSGTRAP